MEERTLTLRHADFESVLDFIENLLYEIPSPACIEEKPEKKIRTEYRFQEPVRKDNVKENQGRITINYSQTTTTEFAAMAGLVLENDPIVFECSQGSDQVVVKGICSAKKESAAWIMPIFDNIWQKLLRSFSD